MCMQVFMLQSLPYAVLTAWATRCVLCQSNSLCVIYIGAEARVRLYSSTRTPHTYVYVFACSVYMCTASCACVCVCVWPWTSRCSRVVVYLAAASEPSHWSIRVTHLPSSLPSTTRYLDHLQQTLERNLCFFSLLCNLILTWCIAHCKLFIIPSTIHYYALFSAFRITIDCDGPLIYKGIPVVCCRLRLPEARWVPLELMGTFLGSSIAFLELPSSNRFCFDFFLLSKPLMKLDNNTA